MRNIPAVKPIRRGERIMVVADNHGDLRDEEACRAAFAFMDDFKPTIRIHLGDCFDFRWLRKSADKDEKDARITDDVNAGIEFLHRYKPTHFLRGNHDERIVDTIESSTGFLAELASRVWRDIEKALKGVPVWPYEKELGVLEIGDWKFLHGYNHGVGATRANALMYGNCAFGHIHRTEMIPAERYGGAVGISIGSLCKRNLPYNRAQSKTMAQKNGWAYGFLRNNKVKLWVAERFDGGWLCPMPTEIRV